MRQFSNSNCESINTFFYLEISEKPEPFTCEHCDKDFSGIWKHYKCLECRTFFVCRQCYDAKKHPPHKVEPRGFPFKGTFCYFLSNSENVLVFQLVNYHKI